MTDPLSKERIEHADKWLSATTELMNFPGYSPTKHDLLASETIRSALELADQMRCIEERSLDVIYECIGEGDIFRNYTNGKLFMREWFLRKLGLMTPK